MNNIDPMLDEHHGKILWCVYGTYCFPTVFTCIIKRNANWYNRPIIWGYSEYRRSPGFRTVGREVEKWASENNAKFFDTEESAFDYIASLITPKCDVAGNKIKKKTKKQKAMEIVERLGIESRVELHGGDRDLILAISKTLPPISSELSTHWWSNRYEINGNVYEIGGGLDTPGNETVELICQSNTII